MNASRQGDVLLAHCRSHGAQYAVFARDRVLLELNEGRAAIAPQQAIVPQTTFNLYSIAKTVTATAIRQLASRGRITLNDDARTYFPGLNFTSSFTVAQLLQHTAGIGNPLPISFVHLVEEADDFDSTAFADTIIARNTRLRSTPGSRFRYSNVGYLMLGRIIEQISGQPFAAYASQHVLAPALRDGDLSFSIRNGERHAVGFHPRMSASYPLLKLMLGRKFMAAVPGGGRYAAFRQHYVNGPAYGGLIGNAMGLVEYGQAHLNGTLVPNPSAAGDSGFALGWFAGGQGRLQHFYHPGGGGGYYAELRLYPVLGLGSVVTTNVSGFSNQKLLDRIDPALAAHFLK